MVLLTSGQVSAAISSAIVFVFTTLLFLSGYALQQQSVRAIQTAIHPPVAPKTVAESNVIAQPFGNEHHFFNFSSVAPITWGRTAYAFLVRDQLHVCNAAMIFATLTRQKSQARKVLLYPSEWDREYEIEIRTKENRGMEKTMQVMRKAALRYQVQLLPMVQIRQNVPPEQKYPLAGLLSLTEYDRLMYLAPSGIVLNSEELDELMTIPMDTAAMVFPDTDSETSPIVMLRPSMEAYNKAVDTVGPIPEKLIMHLESQVADSAHLSSSHLQKMHKEIDSAHYLGSKAYVTLADPGLPGPDFDAPRDQFQAARPEERGARRVWEELYERYRIGRMDVCGLGLEQIPDPPMETSGPRSEDM